MRVAVLTFDVETGNQLGRIETTLARYADENPNAPPQYVMRDEIRDIGACITVHGADGYKLRTEIVKI